ncbi:uncharacterized protein BO72DRAFT_498326 [Aspergillus fijiensis CBS 313.89]|uniref:CN hydrolase domain-containing protein n=1 Tax=Aspergillus fijiensis CBS 313.89 TaxID=1448319 RepID=A0A8G1RKX6_9EURO|nr:uncharacterized protein BO72DRAFT_498326 [Aspergillus fijiensis CBS 313.89]RAK75185.1 hypothetical protein BO72DRAFT_498326 [Aspergillus fijiensis CBS 313.89]
MLLAPFGTLLAAAVTVYATAVPAMRGTRMKQDVDTGFEWDPEAFKIAAVREPPVGFVYHDLWETTTWYNYDLNATIAQSVKIIGQAAAEGVKFIAFPEIYFPGYPAFRTANGPEDFAQYVSQTMEPGDAQWQTLMKAFADAKMYGVVGWAQRANNSLFMTQSLVGPMADGSAGTIWKHEKFRPSGEERTLFSDGLLNTIRAQKLPFGHVYPESRFISGAQPANIHVASFPIGSSVANATVNVNPYTGWHADAKAYAETAAGSPILMLPTYGASGIFSGSTTLNESTNTLTTGSQPYVTTVLNTTTFSDTSYSVNAYNSWGAVENIMQNLPSDMPQRKGPFLQRVIFTIDQLTKAYIWTPGLTCTPTSKWPCLKVWPQHQESDFTASST